MSSSSILGRSGQFEKLREVLARKPLPGADALDDYDTVSESIGTQLERYLAAFRASMGVWRGLTDRPPGVYEREPPNAGPHPTQANERGVQIWTRVYRPFDS